LSHNQPMLHFLPNEENDPDYHQPYFKTYSWNSQTKT
jgi:hypothetical protein